MANYIIGLISGIALALLLGWVGKNTGEVKKLRDQNLELTSANRALTSEIDHKAEQNHKNRALAQPAKPLGRAKETGSSGAGAY